jgi:hypothetical protein
MTPDEHTRSSQQGRGISSEGWNGAGVRVGDLNPSAKKAAQAVLQSRLNFFSQPVRQRIEKIIASQGGLDRMRLGFWGAATQKCRDGGKWDFKLAGPSYLCDYENTRGHIHMSMEGSLAEFKP